MSLIVELKRRNVIRVAVAYGAFAWLLTQVVETVLPFFGISDESIRLIFIVLAIGLVPTVVFAWAFELTPEGIKRERDVDRSASITTQTGRRLDRAIMVTLAVAVAYFALDKFVFDPVRDLEQIEAARAEGAEAGETRRDLAEAPENSIAVLPFVNMSDEPGNEYFSDGVSEELLNLLARAGGLVVASRTSSFYFKGKDTDIPAIARRLQVRHVLEGSVRRSGDRVRVTAQLVDAPSDSHLWSQTYDRELGDIFAVQDDIARSIVEELRTQLAAGHGVGAPEPVARTENLLAYQQYLRALALLRLRGIDNLRASAELLEQVVEIDPGYAGAWSQLAVAYFLIPFYDDEDRPPWLAKARAAALNAIELDPGLAGPHATLAAVHQFSTDEPSVGVVEEFQRAIALDPNFVTARQWYGEFLMHTGQVDEMLEQLQQAHRLDPLAPVVNTALAWAWLYVGRLDRAEQHARTALELGMGGTWAEDVLGHVYVLEGEYDRARAAFGRDHPDFALNRRVAEALADPALVPEVMAQLESARERRISYQPVELMMMLGAADRALDVALAQAQAGTFDFRALWRPPFLAQASDSRFVLIVEAGGLPAYWDETHWPPFCRRGGNESLACATPEPPAR